MTGTFALPCAHANLWLKCYSILPQLVTKGEPEVLKDFATRIRSEAAFAAEDAALKHAIIVALLNAAIAKTSLPLVATVPANASKADPILETAKVYFLACTDLQCPESTQGLLGKVAGPGRLNADDALKRATTLILPFILWTAESLKAHPEMTTSLLSTLTKSAFQLLAEAMIAKPHYVTRENIAMLLQSSKLPGGTELLSTM